MWQAQFTSCSNPYTVSINHTSAALVSPSTPSDSWLWRTDCGNSSRRLCTLHCFAQRCSSDVMYRQSAQTSVEIEWQLLPVHAFEAGVYDSFCKYFDEQNYCLLCEEQTVFFNLASIHKLVRGLYYGQCMASADLSASVWFIPILCRLQISYTYSTVENRKLYILLWKFIEDIIM